MIPAAPPAGPDEAPATRRRIAGEEVGSCNCAWGCPCQFNAPPTCDCEALIALEVREGYYGDTRLEGVRLARILHWPGPIHEGNGTRQSSTRRRRRRRAPRCWQLNAFDWSNG